MQCWNCGANLEISQTEKVSFRATCEVCLADLHVCKNCKHYEPGRANDCLIPGTDFVRDREKNNLCEEFSILGQKKQKMPSDAKKRFDDLFKQ